MIRVTEPAGDYLRLLRDNSNVSADATLRIESSPESGGPMSIRFVASASPGDTVSEAHGMQIALSPEVVEHVDGATIDAVDRDGAPHLVIRHQV